MCSYSTSGLPSSVSILSDSELDMELESWRKCDIDFETLAIAETVDPGTFSTTCFMPPLVTSTVFNTTVESRLIEPTTVSTVRNILLGTRN